MHSEKGITLETPVGPCTTPLQWSPAENVTLPIPVSLDLTRGHALCACSKTHSNGYFLRNVDNDKTKAQGKSNSCQKPGRKEGSDEEYAKDFTGKEYKLDAYGVLV